MSIFNVGKVVVEQEKEITRLKAVNKELVDALEAFMTYKESRAGKYWDIDGNPDEKLISKIEKALKKAAE